MSSVLVTTSAPGKVILHGEHAVVYGYTAVAASIDLRTTVTISRNEKELFQVLLPDMDAECSFPISQLPSGNETEKMREVVECLVGSAGSSFDDLTKKSLVVAVYLFLLADGRVEPLTVKVKTDLPVGAGLGSSASFCVSLAAAYFALCNNVVTQFTPEQKTAISELALAGERVFHFNPSGLDNNICSHGGILKYIKRDATVVDMSQLPHVTGLNVLLVSTGVPRETSKMVGIVAARLKEDKEQITELMIEIQKYTDQFIDIIGKLANKTITPEKSYQEMKAVADCNQSLLSSLGVSHDSIDTICSSVSSFGLSSKLTGAGGGGCVSVLLPPLLDPVFIQQVLSDLHTKGYKTYSSQLICEGVRLEKC